MSWNFIVIENNDTWWWLTSLQPRRLSPRNIAGWFGAPFLEWIWNICDADLTVGAQTSQPDVDFETTFRIHTQVFIPIMWLQTCLACYWDIFILNSVSLNHTIWACWVNSVYLTWVTAPRCNFRQVSLPTCATCSPTGGWKWDSRRDWSCNIDSGCWGHLGQFISAKQIIRLPRGKPKTQHWEGMDQIYPCQLKLPH